ncbi:MULTISPECIES: branched-chain amino acid aminotransferase [unclassified Siphonobacter]|uniref:branched-chain amino acid aminotransferase n=1 Tax=unclassified Siphonobacter TaxID=2635712 RepID=UPI00277D27E4|nr:MULTISPECIES: branched-chain amino acid aminotransferase [unclassified Siphonobacter]MDQ1088656.1 branched-chain amino acid aminotransferase [Siphonobacter sp. SORGH_AS_1065]MDR6194803.1 branched-chain amino acid aminotransferase [Siphonobacter sp. SORGH_AS_0500]
MIDTLPIDIQQTSQSRIGELNLDQLVFGRTFADHMFVADFDGKEWTDLRIVPYGDMAFSPALMPLHYGQAIFEGMKAYKSADGEVLIFRPQENAARLNRSAHRLCMAEIPEDIFLAGLYELLKLDSQWVPQRDNYSLYIRPFMFATDEYIGVSPSKKYRFIIFNCPVGAYYSKPVKVKVETQYVRAAPGGTGAAKCAGNYAASLYPAKLAQEEGYDQLIWTDGAEHKYVEEAGTMNFMFVIDGKLVTPAVSDSILDGITRKSIVQIAKDWGMEVEERKVSIAELIENLENGRLEEAFGAGTAAVVSPISTIGYEGKNFELPEIKADSFANRVKAYLDDIKYGRVEDTHNWIVRL